MRRRTASTALAVALVCPLLLAACTVSGPTVRRPGDADTAGIAPITPVVTAAVEPSGTMPGQTEGVGMTSRKGRKLWLVVAAAAGSEGEAHRMQRKLVELMGEDGSTFVVDRSDDFEGMAPGEWIVVVATDSAAGAREMAAAARKGLFEPTVVHAVKNCDDPIVVLPR